MCKRPRAPSDPEGRSHSTEDTVRSLTAADQRVERASCLARQLTGVSDDGIEFAVVVQSIGVSGGRVATTSSSKRSSSRDAYQTWEKMSQKLERIKSDVTTVGNEAQATLPGLGRFADELANLSKALASYKVDVQRPQRGGR
jgi:hypothetical protein